MNIPSQGRTLAAPAAGSSDRPGARGAAGLEVRELQPSDASAWEAFVQAHPRATFFHQLGWKRVLETTFGHRARYLVAVDAGGLRGILPLFLCRTLRGRVELHSLPHSVYGGPVGADHAAEHALADAALALAAERGATSLEFRNRHANLLALPSLEGCATFEKELPGSVEEVYKTFPKKAREMINQARKRHKLEADFEGTLEEFYPLLAASYKKLGTPVFPRRFFAAMARRFPRDCSILLVRHSGRAVAGVLSMAFRGTMMPLYSGEAAGVHALKANNFKYFRLMERAVELGMRRFDFGRSRLSNAGVVDFKCNQGFVVEALPYQRLGLAEAAEAAPSDPNTGVYPKLRSLWSHLPLPLANAAGPALIRFFP
ncbi:MAG: FemAB family XrtA/PEP-CTERM system-associated protein [Planctomycetaceae bacterium]